MGDWVAVPLPSGGFGLGMIARTRNEWVLGYYFAGRWKEPPPPETTVGRRPEDAILIRVLNEHDVITGQWPVVRRRDPRWKRTDWPVPLFRSEDVVEGFPLVVELSDDLEYLRVERARAEEVAGLPQDGIVSAGSAAQELDALLEGRQ
jgi:hypothetical protein